jgi:hypothetical protein
MQRLFFPSDAGGQIQWPDPNPIIVQRLVAHLAPSAAAFRSRHCYFTGSDRPSVFLPRPDVLVMEVQQDGCATLFRYAADGEDCGMSWHDSVEEAKYDAAQEYSEAIVGQWQPVPEDETEAHAFVIRQADARRTWPLGPRFDRMTLEEWQRSEDVPAMIRALRASWRADGAEFVRLTHRYLLACCRLIWKLLPMEASRRGVEVAERYIEGQVTREEYGAAEWEAEGAAFFLDPDEHYPDDEDPTAKEARIRYYTAREARIGPWEKEVEAIRPEELRRLVRPEPENAAFSPRRLLADAAYFVDLAIAYPGLQARESDIRRYEKFLSAESLREIVGDTYSPD